MGNIKKLINKELIFIKRVMRPQMFMCMMFLVFFPLGSPGLSFVACIMVPYLLLYGTMAYEERSKGDNLMLTLPVSRKNLCTTKYVMGFIYSMIATVITTGMIILGGQIRPNDVLQRYFVDNIGMIMGMMFLVVVLFVSIILPLLLKFGTEKLRYIMMGLYIGAFALTSSIGGILEKINIQVNGFWAIILCIGVYALSYMISLSIYQKREFR